MPVEQSTLHPAAQLCPDWTTCFLEDRVCVCVSQDNSFDLLSPLLQSKFLAVQAVSQLCTQVSRCLLCYRLSEIWHDMSESLHLARI